LFLGIVSWYLYAHKTQPYPGPFTDPLRLFGILAFVLILSTATYSLRRRFFKSLPGKVQDWLWMHTWVGIITILIAMMHEDFVYITHDYCQNASCLTTTYFAGSALFALILLVISGIVGRLLDIWSTHRIARNANANGVGIAQALIARVKELDYTIERLCAGKSTAFKQLCEYGRESDGTELMFTPSRQAIATSEHADMEKAYQILQQRAQLLVSLKRQQHANSIMRIWRYVHMTIATIALLAISYHAVMELLTNVWNVLPPQ
jgi:hypothetical protein